MEQMTQKVEQKIEILTTTDYSKFKTIKGNRKISEKHVRELIRSMQDEKIVAPIQVNEHMETVDGQHRVEASKRLKIPVYYYVVRGAGLHTVQKMNSHTENWKTDDYLESYIERGLKDYKIYKEFMDTYKLPHKVNLMILMGADSFNNENMKRFITGELKVNKLEEGVEMANKLMAMKPYYAGYLKRNWILAVIRALKVPGFSWNQFITKAAYQTSKLVDCTTTDHYLQVIEDIYNYKNRIRTHIRKP